MQEVCYLSGRNPNCPSKRFRVLPYLERFRADGIRTVLTSVPRFAPARVAALLRLSRHETIVLHRLLLPAWQLRLLKRGGARLVYDVDDALPELENARPGRRARLQERFAAVAREADRLVPGNRYLAEALGAAPERTLVLPTPVDTKRFRPAPAANEVPVVVWSGSAPNLPYLETLAAPLRRLAAGQPFRLRVVCDRPPHLPGVPVEFRPWSDRTEVDDIASADVSVMPLPDTPWTRGKCGYKLLLGMSCGLASIASPVGINCEIVAAGRAGWLAATAEEWAERLGQLLASAALRADLGRAARGRVLEHYSLDRCYPHLRDFLAAA